MSASEAPSLLPTRFGERVEWAVQEFWRLRAAGVRAGRHMDGFAALVEEVVAHCGLPPGVSSRGGKATLPGYYRPTKMWDVVIVHERRLIAALEFKSQVGSVGNNFNNRAEEVLGSAADLRRAVEEGICLPHRHVSASAQVFADPRPPFLGYLMLLGDGPEVSVGVGADSPHFLVDPAFQGASYTDRYRLLCERLMAQQLYQAAALVLSADDAAGRAGRWRSPTPATDAMAWFGALAARLLAAGSGA
jgi:hypothetical protein